MNAPQTPVLADDLRAECERIIASTLEGKGIGAALREAGRSADWFNACLAKCPTLATSYARSREIKADLLADETIEIADTEDNPATASNRIKARQWWASKVAPKTYGDRIDLNVSQTLDIAGTLQAARARLSRPNSDLLEGQCEQVIDLLPVSTPQPLDNQSNAPAVPANPVPDIFD